jgi:N-methylhydantoinase B
VSPGIDPMTLAVVEAKLDYITREMGVIMCRSARSPIFSESHDFSCFVATGSGDLVSQADGMPIHTGGGGMAVRAVLAYWDGAILADDVFILNDPYVAGGNHLPDWTVISPVFHRGELVAFTCNRAHQIDIGGGAAGTYNPLAREIFHEGLRIPCVKLYERGTLRRDVMDLITVNTRCPEIVRADVGAMVGSTRVGARRIVEVVEELGVTGFRAYCEALLDYAEAMTRRELEHIPDGTYEAVESMNNGGFTDAPVKIAVRVSVRGSDVSVDFSGTDPQLKSYKNSSLANTYSSVFLAISTLLDPYIPHNEGSYRMIQVVAPRGTVVNPDEPAPLTYATVYPAYEIIHACWKALEQACPERVSAGWGKSCNPISSGIDPDGHLYVMYHFGAFSGAGAVKGRDGFDDIGLLVSLGALTIPNLELYEQMYPVQFLRQEFRLDGGGPGQFRGGSGVEYMVRMKGRAHHYLRGEGLRTPTGFGVCGGRAGKEGLLRVNPGQPDERELPQCGIVELEPSVLFIRTAGGGGWGRPADRDPDRVRRDVEDGMVSVEAARREYGVVFHQDGLAVDAVATAACRSAMNAGAGHVSGDDATGREQADPDAACRRAAGQAP